jgi:predicted membrane protein
LTALKRMTTKDLALATCFTALYAVFGVIKISPIIGLPGQAITAASIVAPLLGIILGPVIAGLSAFLGGLVGSFFGFFSPLSVTAGVATALCSGLISKKKQSYAVLLYLALFLSLTFYPNVGPAWLFPLYSWFQLVGLAILVSPLQSLATSYQKSTSDVRLVYSYFVTALVATLVGQIAGTLTLEFVMSPNRDYFFGTWVATFLLYPVERIIIAVVATVIAVPLAKALRHTNLLS